MNIPVPHPLPEKSDFFLEPVAMRALTGSGIYLHFPYCLSKCPYCDFHSAGLRSGAVPKEELSRYFRSIQEEANFRKERFPPARVTSIYFGGGTASLLPASLVADLLSMLSELFSFDDPEITLEGNPEQMTGTYLASLAGAGVNRVHAGIQSFHPKHLASLGRRHDPERYAAILYDLASSPFANWGIDLMYGIPGQCESDFYDDIERALASGPKHLSLYSLTAEEGTPYAGRIEKGIAEPPDDSLQCEIFDALPALLGRSGFSQYEISNYARPGYESLHNLQYWLYRPYMGLGPGAHGFTGTERYSNDRTVGREYFHSRTYQLHDPALEAPIGFLRLTAPFGIGRCIDLLRSSGLSVDDVSTNTIRSLLNSWTEHGYGEHLKGDLFRWSGEGLRFLDDRIAEMALGVQRQMNQRGTEGGF